MEWPVKNNAMAYMMRQMRVGVHTHGCMVRRSPLLMQNKRPRQKTKSPRLLIRNPLASGVYWYKTTDLVQVLTLHEIGHI